MEYSNSKNSSNQKKTGAVCIEKNIIRRYFYIGSISAIVLLTLLLSVIYTKSINKEHSLKIKQLSTSIINEKKRFLRNAVERTIYLIESERSQVQLENKSKKLTNEQIEAIAKDRIKKKIRNTHLIDNGYIWVNKIVDYKGGDKYGIREIHPNLPDTEGMWLSTKTQDIKGNLPYLAELNAMKKEGELYFEYYFKKMNSEKIAHKISFAKLYKPYDWVVATGVYLDDVDQLIENETKKMQTVHDEDKLYVLLSTLFIILIVLVIIIIFEKQISKLIISYESKINTYTKRLHQYQIYLEQNNELLKESQEIAHFGSWKLDLLNNNLEWSDEIYNIFGVEPQSFQPTYDDFLRFIHPEDRKMVNNAYQESMKTKSDYQVSHRIIKADKTIAYVNEIGHHSFNKDGNVIRSIGTVHDITQEHIAKEKIEEQHKIIVTQSKMTSLVGMLHNIAHQWRQPLSVITTASTGMLLQKEHNMLTDEKFENSCNEINNNAQYLSKIIDDFQMFFSDKDEPLLVDLQSSIIKAEDLVEDSFRDNHIKFINTLDDCQIFIREKNLIQSLVNILNNAKNAMVDNKIDNNCRFVFMCLKKSENEVKITIKDSAGGIPTDIIDKIFEPYFTTQFESQGKGLGLYTTYNMITENLNSTIKVRNSIYTYNNKELKGAEFIITIPYDFKKS